MSEILLNLDIFKVFLLDFRDLKKRTGDWFYDQRVNRFSTMPGHDLVRVSLKKRPQREYRKRKWLSTVQRM